VSGEREPGHCWQQVLDGDVTPEMAAHLVACDHCARMVRGVDEAALRVHTALPPPPASLDERVLAAIHGAGAPPGPARALLGRGGARLRDLPRRHHAAWLVAAAAFVAAVTAAVLSVVGAERAEAVPIAPLTATCEPQSAHAPLLVAGVWSGTEARDFAAVLKRFEDRTGIAVRYAYETRDIAAKLQARLRAGCAPDVALLPQPGLVASLARSGRIQPLDAVAGDLVQRNYGSTWRELGSVDGKLYGVWFKAADKSLVWYRPDAFARAGVAATPSTWAGLVAAAARLRAAGVQPLAVAGADGWTLTDWFENVYLRSAGAVRYDALSRHAIAWTDPSVVSALARLAALLGDPSVAGAPATALRTTFEQSVRDVFDRPQRAAMVFEGDFVRSFLSASTSSAFFGFPALGPGTGSDVVVGGDVAVLFHERPPAARLIRFLATPVAAEPWAESGGFLSPNAALPGSAYPDAAARRAAAALSLAGTVRFDLSDLQPPAFGGTDGQGMWSILRELLTPGVDVEAVARQLEAAAVAAYGS
jgi:ABC-type glycerol-3-phosphate transport system substrate-binding protein